MEIMEIYADEQNGRVYVGDGRGPYIVVERDGSIGQSFTPRGADLVFGADGDLYDAGYDAGFDKGHEESYKRGWDDALASTKTGGS